MIREQTLIVLFDREAAIAIGTINYVIGPVEEMEEHTIRALQNLRRVLELPPLCLPDGQPSAADQEPVRSATAAT